MSTSALVLPPRTCCTTRARLVGASRARWAVAGVAVAVRKTVGRGNVHATSGHSPKLALGRLSASWVQVGPDIGIVAISFYMFHSEGLAVRNKRLFEQAIATVKSDGSHGSFAGTLTCPSQNLQSSSDTRWSLPTPRFSRLRLLHIAPPTGTHRVLDYLICSASVHPWVDMVNVDQGVAAAPHRAIQVRIRAERHNFRADVLWSPKQFLGASPIDGQSERRA